MELKCLVIKKKWLDLILSGEKTVEIRGCNCKHRGIIGLIESGSGKIVGIANLTASAYLNRENWEKLYSSHKVPLSYDKLPYKKPHGWSISNARRIDPIPYSHPQGAVIWVKVKIDKIPA